MNGVYVPAISRKIAAWSSARNTDLARGQGRAWYRVENRYNRIIDPAKTAAPATAAAFPRWTAEYTRNGAAASDASSPAPWLTLLAISSPRDCGRFAGASAMA